MAGLCKPYAAELLVKTLKQEVGIPIHFHTHDTSGVQAAAVLKAAEANVDIADGAIASLSGLTSQPNLNSLVEALRYTPRDTGLTYENLQAVDIYWGAVREFYAPFEAGMIASTADVYYNEIPGGQYTNLYQQAAAIGLAARWPEICRMYAEVNRMLGDIVKVTPSSKAVGDLALFMITNNLSVQDVLDSKRELAFPESVVDLVSGRMGQPPGGFPAKVRQRILRGERPLRGRAGGQMPPANLDQVSEGLEKRLGRKPSRRDVLSSLLYPKVFDEFLTHQEEFSDVSVLPTNLFFYGQAPGQEASIDLEPGKTLIVKFLTVGDPHTDGRRTVFFELNGQPRSIDIRDWSLDAETQARPKADRNRPDEIGAPMPGLVVAVAVREGDTVAAGQKLLTLEAMKMETTIYAEREGTVTEVLVVPRDRVDANDLLLRLDEA
jgi:pyruvate carboxylase